MLLLAAVLGCVTASGWAQSSQAAGTATTDDPFRVATSHRGVFHGVTVAYEATAGQTVVRDDHGAPEAAIFSVAYVADSKARENRRPVTFLYNGGPGSASFWIQMGAFGPRIAAYDSQRGGGAGARGKLIDNPDALLDVSDLVFVDPVGTGFSRAMGQKKNEDFYKISTDAELMLRFIKTWLSVNHRWGSPRFIGGESYGSIRTAMVLGQENWLDFDGAILISQGLDWGTVISPPGYDLGYSLYLPTFAATAWYHHWLPHAPATVEEAVERAERFSQDHYVAALAKGAFLSDEERQSTARQLEALTGLPARTWMQQDLRIDPDYFLAQLLADEGLYLGRFDTRFATRFLSAYDPARRMDPSLDPEATAYIEAMRTYLGDELEVPSVAAYKPLTSMSGDASWTYDLDNGAFINPATRLGDAMRANAGMTLFVASGYFDASSPVYSARYNIGHAGVDMRRVTMTYYPTGHMMYIDPVYRVKLLNDIRSYLVRSLRGTGKLTDGGGA